MSVALNSALDWFYVNLNESHNPSSVVLYLGIRLMLGIISSICTVYFSKVDAFSASCWRSTIARGHMSRLSCHSCLVLRRDWSRLKQVNQIVVVPAFWRITLPQLLILHDAQFLTRIVCNHSGVLGKALRALQRWRRERAL